MSELINGRTPEEIKERLACCSKEGGCYVCPDVAAGDCSLKLCADALALIERLESERDAAPVVHTKWISEIVTKCDWKGRLKQYYQPCSCSACHEPAIQKYNYCPNCGARMDEKEND